jgi:hypothetical protein
MLDLKEATTQTIKTLLTKEHDWEALNTILISMALFRGKVDGGEKHHIEPDRDRVVYLLPLEHLASHICTAKANPTDSTHAKVGAFVHYFPGSYRRIVELPEEVRSLVLKFGQTRPSKTGEEMTRIANLPQSKTAQKAVGSLTGKSNGIKGAEKVSKRLKGRKITWGDKISKAIEAKGTYTCPNCGKVMKNISSNILQHQRSKKCKQKSPACL